MENPLRYFDELRDSRVERNRHHLLEEIPPIAIAAVLSGIRYAPALISSALDTRIPGK
jgi:hypothetical protein